ncbi:hypothetical protein GMA19_01799 [Paenibacillus polymyxa E681]|nr:hypothetical protein GE561_01799 [Paenibacillus polymyxa E681]QNV61472.1 hypothetical protein GMA19_01799 [Paenibacillus polymyxa E681]
MLMYITKEGLGVELSDNRSFVRNLSIQHLTVGI